MLSRHSKMALVAALLSIGAPVVPFKGDYVRRNQELDPETQKIKNSKAQLKRERRMARNKALLDKSK